jgi:acyl-CoA synthetase (AMP-forming)/AMP-acid ligase II
MSGFTNLGDLIPRDRDLAKIAIIDLGGEQSPREFTFAQLDAMANGVARALARRGLQRGDRIALLSANRAEYIATYYGIMRSGFVAVPVNFKFPRDTIHFIIGDAGAKLIFCDAARAADCPSDIAVVRFGFSSPSPAGGGSRAAGARGGVKDDGSSSASRVHKPHLDEMHGPESLPYRPGRATPRKPTPDDIEPGSGSKIFQPTSSREAVLGRSTGGAPGHRGGWKKR